MKFYLHEHPDGRSAIALDRINSVYEVTLEGDDYVAIEADTHTYYLLREEGLLKEILHKIEWMYKAVDVRNKFLVVTVNGKKEAILIDKILSIDETNIEGEYYVELTILTNRENVNKYVEERFDDLIKQLTI